MMHTIKSHTLLVNFANRSFRVHWNELDGCHIPGMTEREFAALMHVVSPAEPAEKPDVAPPKNPDQRKWDSPRIETPDEVESETPIRVVVEKAPEVPVEDVVVAQHEPSEVADVQPAKPEETDASVMAAPTDLTVHNSEEQPEEEPEPEETSITDDVDDGPLEVQDIQPWPTAGETWLHDKIVSCEVRTTGGEEYAKVLLDNGERVKLVRGTDNTLIESVRLPAVKNSEASEIVTTVATPKAPPEEPSVPEGVDFVPPLHCRTSKRVVDTIRWLVEAKKIEDEAELVRICMIYKAAKICDSFETVADMNRRVETTLRAMGVKNA